ncbi:cytochrome b5 domain-containing protein [Marinimicrobium sp. C6131]|uniref:cytochrome b5 domain-containing protein n=1 Tax=Marinimicrobium sp. C6131 TaxID=3022676 RepID=UPI00223DAC73|nr:cytochrome b5-like heme/steroid binding domain-containing protein [Marinimicrobium sp. C6131]UZJ45975.1 cytochrome b5 domain-containing protein [Marinimicrobium sp. C6131]
MKKTAFAAFVAFWSSVLTLLATWALVPAVTLAEAQQVFTLEEVARHDRQEDCWMAIRGDVYDVTGYLPQHPAPPAVILPWCGREATEGMTTKGYGRDHSPAAWEELEAYRIGTLEQAVDAGD